MASDMTGTGPELATEGAVVTRIPSEPDEKNVANIGSHPTQESDKPKDFPLSWKLTALACGVALSFGSSFAENILGPLKSTLRKELEIDNARVSSQYDMKCM